MVRALADTVMVMKDGAIVEHGPTGTIFDEPQTAYTKGLMKAAFQYTREAAPTETAA